MNKVSQTIVDQIGNKAFRMIGAKAIVELEDGIVVKLGSGARGKNGAVTHFTVVYNRGADLYDVTFSWHRGVQVKTRASHEGVFATMLHELIEAETGFYTSL